MDKKYYFISYRIDLGSSNPLYSQEIIDKTPLEYVISWKDIGGDYAERIILFAQEITEDEYNYYKDKELSVN